MRAKEVIKLSRLKIFAIICFIILGFFWFLTVAATPIATEAGQLILGPVFTWIAVATLFMGALTILSLILLLLLVRRADAVNERMDSLETSLKKLTASQAVPKPPE